jgi:hypothetical protein
VCVCVCGGGGEGWNNLCFYLHQSNNFMYCGVTHLVHEHVCPYVHSPPPRALQPVVEFWLPIHFSIPSGLWPCMPVSYSHYLQILFNTISPSFL